MPRGTSEAHDHGMTNLHFTQQQVREIRCAKETEARRRRLVKGKS
jgi:hypothetical protein